MRARKLAALPTVALAALVFALAASASLAADEPPPPPLAGQDELAPEPNATPQDGQGADAPENGSATAPSAGTAARPVPPRNAVQQRTESDDPIARGLALEAVGLPVDAGAAFRKAERAGLGDRGVEAGRRADALGEVEEALRLVARRKARPAKAALASALQTLRRQEQAQGWAISAALAGYLAQAASAVRDGRNAKALAQIAAAAGPEATAMAGVAAAAVARRSALRLYRCLGGPDRSEANAVVALAGGYLVTGATGSGDDQQVWSWRLDAYGHVQRAGGFGAAGADRALAALHTPQGIWLVGSTAGRAGTDALALRVDETLRPLAHADHDLGGRERATAIAQDGDGQPWMLVEGEVGDPAGPHRAAWLVALGPDGKARKTAKLPIGRQGFVTTLLLDSQKGEALLYGGGRGVGESAGGLLRAFSVGSATPDADEGPDFPGPVLAGAELGRGALALLGAKGEGAGQRLWIGGRDKRRRWQKTRDLPRGIHAASATLLPQRRGVLALLAPADEAPSDDAAASATGGVWTVDPRGRAKAVFSAPGFAPRAALAEGREVVVVGTAHGCGRAGLDATWLKIAP